MRVWAAQATAGRGAPGEVLSVSPAGIEVACAEGSLLLTDIQLPGKRLCRWPTCCVVTATFSSPGRNSDGR